MPVQVLNLPIEGLNTLDPLSIQPTHSPNLQNVRLEFDNFRKRPGISKWRANFAGRNLYEAGFPDRLASQLLMFDENLLYMWSPVFADWESVDPGAILGIYVMSQDERFSIINTIGQVFWTSWNSQIRRYDGTNAAILVNDLDLSMTALALLSFADRIIAVRTREFNVPHPSRVRWCSNGEPTKWNEALNDGCGFLEIVENTNFPLTGGMVINNRCFITKEREIVELIFDPSPSRTFRQETRQQGIGMIAPHSWGSGDYFGFFLGPDSVYSWDGSSVKEIGRPVKKELFENLNMSHTVLTSSLQSIQGQVFARSSEYWLLMPDGRVFIYDYRRDRWFRDDYENLGSINCMCELRPSELRLLPGPDPNIEDLIEHDTMMLNATVALPFFGGTLDVPCTYVQDSTRFSDQTADAGSVDGDRLQFEVYFETRDVFGLDFQGGGAQSSVRKWNSLQRVEFKTDPGARIAVGASSDLGETWTETEVVAGRDGTAIAHFIFPFQTCRFRLRSKSANERFRVRGAVAYAWKPAGGSQASG